MVVREVLGVDVGAYNGHIAFDGDVVLGFAPWRLDEDEDVFLAEDLEGFAVDELRGQEQGEVVVVAGVAIVQVAAESQRREDMAVYL